MPEVRHNFTGGKMNKDLDERLVPNGEYRHALNVEVSTSEGSDVGTVQNILGNKRVDDLVGADFNCVGSIADEKNNKLYWFISKYEKDVILEYDITNDMASPVLVDLKGGTQKAVLKFFGNTITGINIIDDLLFWSDDKGEPKKINIKRCKEGTANINTHTQLSFINNSFTGIAVEYIFNETNPVDGGYGFGAAYHSPLTPIEKRPKIGMYSAYERRRLAAAVGVDFNNFVDNHGNIKDANNHISGSSADDNSSFDENGDSSTGNLGSGDPNDGYVFKARHYRGGELLVGKNITVFDNSNGLHFRYTTNKTEKDFKIGDVIFAENTKLDIEEKHITVIKPKPLKAPSVKINYKEQTKTTNKKPNLFEEQFPRFSYRYKYADGEFSAFAPFTEPVFNPQYTQNTDKSTDGSVLYGKDDIYDIKDPKNKAMVNAIHSVDLMDFITINTPEDVVEVDLLYKKEDSPVIYSIGTVNHTDFEWHASAFNHEHGQSFIGGADRYDDNISYDTIAGAKNWMPAADGGYNSGKYTVKNENIYAALPANQLLRPWDNVPRKALAQEVSGSRIIYGNYLQNYTIGSKPKVFVDYNDRKKTIGTFDTGGLPSIKSQRNYQLGVIYCDEFGRETPVFTSNSAAVNIPWAENDGSKNASKSNQMIASVESNFPDWVDSIKFFVKENSGEYYNLTMERAWTGKSTYELDNSEGHLWMSFPSSDRNKISKEDSIILKKKIGVGEEQISFENKFTVIDIKDEAPDAIKYELVNLGTVINDADDVMTVSPASYDKIFSQPAERPDKLQDVIALDITSWMNGGGHRDELIMGDAYVSNAITGSSGKAPENLYVSWSRSGGASSSKYKVSGGWKGSGGYVLKLNREITEKDADIAHVNGKSGTQTTETHLHQDLIFQVEKRVAKDDENFSGQFFVKISKNHITSIVETGNELSNLDKFQVTADQGVWYWRDDTDGNTQTNQGGFNPFIFQSGAPYGLTNYDGDTGGTFSASNNIQQGGGSNTNQNAEGGTARLTDWHGMWENILGELTGKPRWFVDSMHMASGQSDASDYAKYNCVTWSGSRDHDPGHQYLWPAKSAWGYPPLKKWFTEVTENEINVEGSEGDYFTENNPTGVVSTSNLFDQNANWLAYDDVSGENVGLQIDGWVGVTQNVSRWTSLDSSGNHHNDTISQNHINGLEGMVTTNEYHTTGPRRWFSGMNGIESGNGEDTKTYSSTGDETEKHFMHLSFFAPGKDLHDNTWHFEIGASALYGKNAWMDNLQGIWGGGVFTGTSKSQKFGANGDAANKHFHLAMEGNYADGEDNNYQVYSTPPGPGSGFGYDLDYRELHERQWDPTFNSENDPENKIRDFIRNLHPGSKFRFNHKKPGVASTDLELDDEVYTIKKVRVKKLYNHTSWRTPHNQYRSGSGGYVWDDLNTVNVAYRSVEDLALGHLNQVDSAGISNASINNSPGDYTTDNAYMLKKKIVDFGAAHNRRVCYVIELNKNPATWGPESSSTMGNPLNSTVNGNDAMTAGLDGDTYTHVEFLDPVQDIVLKDLSKFPAIWELSPKKQDVDLDIYYEASNNIPVRINGHTNELFAPKGCLVEMINPPSNHGYSDVHLVEWSGNTATLEPGFNRGDVDGEVDYSGIKFKFIRRDGSYTVAEAGLQQLTAAVSGYKTRFVFKQNISSKIQVGLAWYNCFSFGNGLESNRIQDGFNNMFITNGVKASTTVQETYQEEHRKHGIIYSGLYNSNSGINNLNQFIMAEKITKDLNPTYGSIQKLFSRDTDLIAFCEDKVLRILANKDAVFNADGSAQLTSNQNVLGQAVPFQGEYGISKNPESFASESYRAYFTDKQRGAVLRLSKDGLTPISKAGMHDWFRDNLSKHTSLVGTYDSYKENYNITLSNTYTENIIFNTYFRLGAESVPLDATVLSSVTGGAPISGSAYEHSWETKNILTNSQYNFNTGGSNAVDPMFKHNITVTNHPAIPIGRFQTAVTASTPTPSPNYAVVSSTDFVGAQAEILDDDAVDFVAEIPFIPAAYMTTPGTNNGWWYKPDFEDWIYQIWGYANNPSNSSGFDAEVFSSIFRKINGATLTGDLISPHYGGWPIHYNPNNGGKRIAYPAFQSQLAKPKWISQCVTRNTGDAQGTPGAITFDRCDPSDSYVEFRNIGGHSSYPASHPSLEDYNIATGGSESHASFFNGDEIFIQFELTVFKTYTGNSNNSYGYNYIKPRIQLFDGNTQIMGYRLVTTTTHQSTQGTQDDYAYLQNSPGSYGNLGGDFAFESSGGITYTNVISGGAADVDYACVKYWPDENGAHTFPDTSVAGNFNTAGNPTEASSSGSLGTVKIICGVCFKFRDPIQQDSTGAAIDPSNPNIVETKVVNDLRIRIDNTKPAQPTNSYHSSYSAKEFNNSSNTIYPFRHQLWEINNLKIKKGFGVTAPHQSFVEQVDAQDATVLQAYNAGVYTEWFDDVETTGVVESLTTADIIAGGGALNDNGDWVLNQTAIDAWNQTYPGGQIYACPNIPLDDVPAFVEVSHSDGNWQKGAYNMDSGHTQQYNTYTSAFFGNNREAIADSAYKTSTTTGLTTTLATWYKPGLDPTDQSGQEGNYGNTSQFDKTLVDGKRTTQYPNGQSYSPPGQAQLPALNGTSSTPVTKTYNDFVVDWWRVETAGDSSSNTSQAYSMHFPLGTDDELQTGQWYMVDVELKDTFHPNQYDYNNGVPPFTDSYGSGAFVCVKGAGTGSVSAGYNYGESGGYGFQTGGSNDRHVVCVPAWRTRYDSGNPRWVLRAIFKLETDSWAYPSNLDKIILRFYYVNPDPWYVNKIICKKVSYKNNTGSATSWSRPGIYSGTDHHLQLNAFSESKLYYHSQALCYDEVMKENNYLNGTSGSYEDWWNQVFAAGKEVTNTGSGWILNFKVGANPKTNLSFSDNANSKLGIKVTGPIGEYSPVTYPDQFTGMFANIEHEGEYQIKFDMSGTFNSDWSVKRGGSDYAAPFFSEYSQTPSGDALSDNDNNGVGVSNSIGFYNAVDSTPLSCSVFDVYLTQTETVFSGGQAGSWGFDGFDSTSEQFITWDIYWPDGQVGTNADGRIQFSNCPLSDPSFGNGNTIISANQYIDKVINRYEKYEISFNFNMQTQNEEGATIDGQGLFHMYYFNGSGYGFRINDIGDEDFATLIAPNYTKEAIYNQSMIDAGSTLEDAFLWWRVTKIVGIGDGSIYDPATGNGNITGTNPHSTSENAYSEFQTQGAEALRDTLVIRKDGSVDDNVTGWIDDISMKRVYDVEMTSGPDGIPGNEDDVAVYPETTLTFSEDVKGWTSFKSFIPESGVSLSKKYFTFKDGYLYQHYKPLKLNEDNVHWDDCNYVDAENYNHFYDHLPVSEHNYSEIVAVINVEPNVVKTFNTLSYEGSQAHVTNPGAIALEKPKLINQNNALAWALNDYNATPTLYPNIDGWTCVDIKTDLDDGQLLDFIKKEGKWFGYIRGKHIVGKLDASRFSVQGLGRIEVDNINP